MRFIDSIIIHCSAARENSGQTMEEIKAFHMDVWNFDDIGYHYVIEDDGTIVAGRPLDVKGAHALGWNDRSVGICYTGGGRSRDGVKMISGPNDRQNLSLRSLTMGLKMVFPSIHIVKGHRDTGSNKDCPCFDVPLWDRTGLVKVSRNLA